MKNSLKGGIIYQDDHIVGLNKYPGMPAVPDQTDNQSAKDRLEQIIDQKLYILHRIDRPTSGIILFAKSKKAATYYSQLFACYEHIEKSYIAVTEHQLQNNNGKLEDYLIRSSTLNKSYVTADKKRGKYSLLYYRFLLKTDNYWVYDIDLRTGRHHQIRTQLAHQSCPIKGDVKYGARRNNKNRSIHLHARKLKFKTMDHRQIVLQADFWEDPLWNFINNKLLTISL